MATRAIASKKLARGVQEWKWTGLLDGDDGGPLNPDGGSVVFSDKTVHVKGTFGTGGTVVIEGSNDGVTYIQLTDPQGNSLGAITAEAIEAILENPEFIRPRVSGGDGNTNLTVIMVGRAVIQIK